MVKCVELVKKKMVEAKIRKEKCCQIAQNLGVLLFTVSRTVRAGQLHALTPQLGRPPITDPKNQKFLVNKILTNETKNATTPAKLLKEMKGIEICPNMQQFWLDVN